MALIRFRDDQVYNQVARWVTQRRAHTINRYFASYPEQLELAGIQDILGEFRKPPRRQNSPDDVVACCDEGYDRQQNVQILKMAGKIALGVGGAYLLWRMARRVRRRH